MNTTFDEFLTDVSKGTDAQCVIVISPKAEFLTACTQELSKTFTVISHKG